MIYPVALCVIAGLSTGLGGLAVVLAGGADDSRISFSQGFAAGVMVTVSLADLMVESFEKYCVYMPEFTALKAVLSLFFTGWIMGSAIEGIALPREKYKGDSVESVRRMAAVTTLVMVLHNLPEGVLTMFTATRDTAMGLRVALAVALHNLPEGMAIAAPVVYVTGSRRRAFLRSLLAGLAEPAGGIIAYLLLKDLLSAAFLNGVMPVVAGIMCQAAICELLPDAIKLSNIKHTIYGTIAGILMMSIGLFLF